MIRRPPRSTLFPYRRSSDLERDPQAGPPTRPGPPVLGPLLDLARRAPADRKSTRLNSSHQIISYAVFFLKKKIDTHTPLVIIFEYAITHLPTQASQLYMSHQ